MNLNLFSSLVTARWFNPAKEAALRLHPALLANRAGQTLTTPGDNGTGVNDWTLVLEGHLASPENR